MNCMARTKHSVGLGRGLRVACAVALAVTSAGCSNSDARKRAYYERGLQRFDQGDLASARVDMRNVLQIDPKHALAWLALGQIEERSGDAQEALEAYAQAVRLMPRHADARMRHAQFLASAGELAQAQQDLDVTLRASPSHPDALTLRGSLRQIQGDAAGAVGDALAGLAGRPGHSGASLLLAVSLLDTGRVAEAQRLLEAQVAARRDDVDLLLLLGRARDRSGDLDGAVAALREALARAPDRHDVRRGLGRYLVVTGRAEEAKRLLREGSVSGHGREALGSDLVDLLAQTEGATSALAELAVLMAQLPDATELRLKVARLQGAALDPTRAEPIYREIVARAPRSRNAEMARLELASLLVELGRGDTAREVLDDQLAVQPRHVGALSARARLALRQGETARASADLRTVLAERPGDASARRLLAEAHRLEGNAQAATAELEKAIASAPDEPEAYLALADLQRRAGKPERALDVLSRLLYRQPGPSSSAKAVALTQLPAGEWGSLDEVARCLMDTRPDDPLGYYLQGLLLQRRGEPEGSARLFQRVLDLRPESVGPLVGLARSLLAGDRGEAIDGAVDLVGLGDVEAAAGRLEGARALFEQAIRFEPRARRAYDRLAGVLIRQGELAEAVGVLRVGIEVSRDHAAVARRIADLNVRLANGRTTFAGHDAITDRFPSFEGLDNALALLLPGDGPAGRALPASTPRIAGRDGGRRPLRPWGLLRDRRGDDVAALRYLERVGNAAAIVVGAVLAGFLVVMRRGSGGQGRAAGS
jgi:Tfp pilus assembly protein PilF